MLLDDALRAFRLIERVRKEEHRTRSELVREALRHYMGRNAHIRRMQERIAELPEDEATAEELEAIAEARRAFRSRVRSRIVR